MIAGTGPIWDECSDLDDDSTGGSIPDQTTVVVVVVGSGIDATAQTVIDQMRKQKINLGIRMVTAAGFHGPVIASDVSYELEAAEKEFHRMKECPDEDWEDDPVPKIPEKRLPPCQHANARRSAALVQNKPRNRQREFRQRAKK